MINCIIVDDEQHAIDVLAYHVKQTSSLNLLHTCNSSIEAFEYLNNNQHVQLLFVDIQMPGITGIELVKIIQNKNLKVIFCTAYSEYAVDGFDLNIADYLLKPISFVRFTKAVQKVTEQILSEEIIISSEQNNKEYFFVKTEQKGKMAKLSYNDIDYLESRRNYIAIFSNHQNNMVLSTMKEMEEKLPSNKFVRIHKSYMVSIAKISTMQGTYINIVNYKHTLPVGDNYREGLKKALSQKLL